MEPSDAVLKSEAKRAYERGRFFAAARVLALIAPAALASAVLISSTAVPLAIGAILTIAAVAMLHRGGAHGRAVYPGLAGGFSAAGLAILMRKLGVCAPEEAELCALMSIIGGAAAGVIVMGRAFHVDAGRAAYLVSATAIVFLAGSLGCICFGLSGLAGLAFGVTIGTVPVAIAARLAR